MPLNTGNKISKSLEKKRRISQNIFCKIKLSERTMTKPNLKKEKVKESEESSTRKLANSSRQKEKNKFPKKGPQENLKCKTETRDDVHFKKFMHSSNYSEPFLTILFI